MVRNSAQTFLAGPFRLGGIVKRPIEGLEREGVEAWTVLLRRVTHDNGIVDADPAEKVVEALGVQSAGVEAGFRQDLARQWMHLGRHEARAQHLETVAGIVMQERLGDLTACRVMRA